MNLMAFPQGGGGGLAYERTGLLLYLLGVKKVVW